MSNKGTIKWFSNAKGFGLFSPTMVKVISSSTTAQLMWRAIKLSRLDSMLALILNEATRDYMQLISIPWTTVDA